MKLNKLLTKGKAVFLAYDQGLEHGPESDFNDKNVDPLYILDIAKKGKFNAIVFGKGIAEQYESEIRKSKIPLILKLNGKTKLVKGEPVSAQLCTVKRAKELGATGVGFTIYIGSAYEVKMLEQFAKIEREAHKLGMPVVVWIYPRGKSVKRPDSRENLAYAARVGLEIGADIIKVHWAGSLSDLKWAVKSAGRAKLVVAGGSKKSDSELLQSVKKVKQAGAAGLAIGRNVWQNKDPIGMSKKIKKILF
tara:strand:- start:5031 stop:5777 length:747 start_codon:yes stop_codon:yes gene_type:complete